MTLPTRLKVFAALLVLLAATRIGHFGSVVSLPDASLAVFLLGGAWLGGGRLNGWGCFATLIATAFAIDVGLAQTATEAGWCLTPAYGGLVVAYLAVWGLGRWLGRAELSAPRLAGFGLAAVTVHFLVSNLSFWAASGYFGDLGLIEYLNRVAQYFAGYLASTALYLTLGWIALRLVSARRAAAPLPR